jgi:hypothetical protein
VKAYLVGAFLWLAACGGAPSDPAPSNVDTLAYCSPPGGSGHCPQGWKAWVCLASAPRPTSCEQMGTVGKGEGAYECCPGE